MQRIARDGANRGARMRVSYLGPAVVGVEHPAVAEMDRRKFSPSCFLVEISDEVPPGGPWMEGDVLVVDEARSYGPPLWWWRR